jgi:hypothetical protein
VNSENLVYPDVGNMFGSSGLMDRYVVVELS